MNSDAVLYTRAEKVAIIQLNRPEAYNCINANMAKCLEHFLNKAYQDESVHVIILTGTGEKAFCAGLDLKALSKNPDILQNDSALAKLLHFRAKPMIGAINGYAITGGLELALACDLLYASDNAVFSDTHCKVGIMPTWGISQKLPRLIGYARAKEMSFTGRKIKAELALKWGLVNRVVRPASLMSDALQLATEMAENNAQHIQNLRHIMDKGADLSLTDALAYERKFSLEKNAEIDFSRMVDRLNKMRGK